MVVAGIGTTIKLDAAGLLSSAGTGLLTSVVAGAVATLPALVHRSLLENTTPPPQGGGLMCFQQPGDWYRC
jgi:hypothetical protein